MRSEAQIEASRRNGAKSKGPITAQGKRHSRRNALKHGLLASSALLAEESGRAYQDLFESTRDAVEPANAIEDRLVEMLAAAFWKLSRAHSLLKVGLDRAIATEHADFPAPVRAVLILGSSHPAAVDWLRLEKLAARAEASIHRNLARLTALRTSRTVAADPILVALADSLRHTTFSAPAETQTLPQPEPTQHVVENKEAPIAAERDIPPSMGVPEAPMPRIRHSAALAAECVLQKGSFEGLQFPEQCPPGQRLFSSHTYS